MIDLQNEEIIPLAPKAFPSRPSIPTIWRWQGRGVGGVRLETIVIGGRRFTSREAIDRFIAATTAKRDGPPVSLRSPAARQRAILKAERELRDAGI